MATAMVSARSEARYNWASAVDNCDAQMDREEFWELFCGLYDGCGRKAPSRAQGRVWYIALADINTEQFVRAIALYLTQHSREFLSVQLIRELAGVQVAAEDAAVVAWSQVLDAIRKHGAYYSVRFDDPVINAAIVSMGGWVELCSKSSEELLKWTPKEFEKVYRAMLSRGTGSDEPMVGLIERSHGMHGYRGIEPPTVRIGCGNRVRAITQENDTKP